MAVVRAENFGPVRAAVRVEGGSDAVARVNIGPSGPSRSVRRRARSRASTPGGAGLFSALVPGGERAGARGSAAARDG